MRRQAGIDAETDAGGKIGEFTVWVDGKCVGRKDQFLKFPGKERLLAAVQEELGTVSEDLE